MNQKLDLPSDQDLRELLRFSREDGRIWLAGQRMLLMHANALQAIRKEMINSLGASYARRILMRAGKAAGEEDALLARQIRPNASVFEAFSVGPQLHTLEGAVQVEPICFEHDPAKNHFLGIFRWRQSWEAEAQINDYGLNPSMPACWMLLGYATGYSSAFFGKAVLYQETHCTAAGNEYCQIEGRFEAEWPESSSIRADYQWQSSPLLRTEKRPDTPPLLDDLGPLLGNSPAFQQALYLLRQAAPTKVNVLLTGETGVGKERFARSLHKLSDRADKPFVAINCAALPAELIESELFGAEKGAFTGATQTRIGRFERADGGTILLDELAELPYAVQAKLLRVIQQGEVERLGGTETRKVDVRIIAATNQHLEQAVAEGRFRQDLFYRLNVYPIRLPPLRDRLDDIKLLSDHFLQKYTQHHNKKITTFSSQAYSALRNHRWLGNVRELENTIERAVILSENQTEIQAKALFADLQPPQSDHLLADGSLSITDKQGVFQLSDLLAYMQQKQISLSDLENNLLQQAVKEQQGNLTAAARTLGLTRPQLSYRLKRNTS